MHDQVKDPIDTIIVKGSLLVLAIILAGMFLIANTGLKMLLSQLNVQPPSEVQSVPCRVYEKVLISYSDGLPGTQTEYSYSGLVLLTIEGSGQASGSAQSDAFYIFTDASGNTIPPEYPQDWILTINSKLAHRFIKDWAVPDYSPDHIYQVEVIAPGEPLYLGIDDGYTPDNTGWLLVSICQQ
jgi:hypothetical protein